MEAYWKQCVAWVTDWLNKYRFDGFFRAEVNVIVLQITFALLTLGLVGASFSLFYDTISASIIEKIQGVHAGATIHAPGILAPTIVQQLQFIKGGNLLIVLGFVVLATIFLGYLVARITLKPARDALALQKQFIGNIAHELRNPLSIIKANTEIALLNMTDESDLKDMFNSNIEELDRISDIINNLLSLSAPSQPVHMKFASVDLSVIVARVIRKLSQAARHEKIKIIMRESPSAFVWGNASALEQIVNNILKNAIQYTPRGGHISITLEPSLGNDHTELIIQDSGIGIDRKDLFHIFDPFYRTGPSRARAREGSGLGLSIVSELIKAHGGKIIVRSSIGHGTMIRVLLPGKEAGKVSEKPHNENADEVSLDFLRHMHP